MDLATEILDVSRCNRIFALGSAVIVEVCVADPDSLEIDRVNTRRYLNNLENKFSFNLNDHKYVNIQSNLWFDRSFAKM